MAFLWVHSRLGGWRESAVRLITAAISAEGGTISKADTFPGIRPETECSVHDGAIASSRRKRMVSVNQARSFLATCGILGICCAALLVAHASSPRSWKLKTGIQLKSCCHHRGRPPRSRAGEGKLGSGRRLKGLAEDQPGHYPNSEIAPRPSDRICERVEAAGER